jgi:hypothetical protein
MRTSAFIASVVLAQSNHVALENFASPIHKWSEKNDPVMGGKSTGTFTIENNVGVFDGQVNDVPALQAPGFITTQSVDHIAFPDASHCKALSLTVKSSVEYSGYRVSFGTAHPKGGKFFAYGYKAHFDAPVGMFDTVVVPFTNFSDFWDDATGKQIHTCAENKDYCPDKATLEDMKTITIWGEGVKGKVHLEIRQIAATQCDTAISRKVMHEAMIASADDYAVDLVTFDGSKTDVEWRDMNDPVMGGLSKSTFVVKDGMAIFNGTVEIVPQLKAPGFCNAETKLTFKKFADVSSYSHLMLKVRTPKDFKGFKVSFAANTLNPQFDSFKANYDVPVGSDWSYVAIPFNSFSNDWSPYTGDCDTKDPTGKQHVCCSSDHPEVCPTAKNLRDIIQIGLWAEGVQGSFHLEIERIGAGNPSAALASF